LMADLMAVLSVDLMELYNWKEKERMLDNHSTHLIDRNR
jgi:hypothetical protein